MRVGKSEIIFFFQTHHHALNTISKNSRENKLLNMLLIIPVPGTLVLAFLTITIIIMVSYFNGFPEVERTISSKIISLHGLSILFSGVQMGDAMA